MPNIECIDVVTLAIVFTVTDADGIVLTERETVDVDLPRAVLGSDWDTALTEAEGLHADDILSASSYGGGDMEGISLISWELKTYNVEKDYMD